MPASSVPLSHTHVAGRPREAIRVWSSRTTRKASNKVSGTSARHSRVESSTTVRMRKRRPLASVSATKSIDQRRLRFCGMVIGTQGPFAPATLAHRQPFLLVEAIRLLAIEFDALALEHQAQASTTEPPSLRCQFTQAPAQLFIARPLCCIAIGLAVRADQATSASLLIALL